MNTTELCKGFLNYADRAEWIEIHSAVLVDGTVLQCEVPGPTSHFGKTRTGKPAEWKRVPALPAGAEFIGNYPAPKIAAAA